jgi:hypothetical protein
MRSFGRGRARARAPSPHGATRLARPREKEPGRVKRSRAAGASAAALAPASQPRAASDEERLEREAGGEDQKVPAMARIMADVKVEAVGAVVVAAAPAAPQWCGWWR